MTIEVSTVPEAAVSLSGKVDRAAALAQLLNLRSPLSPSIERLQAVRDQAAAIVQELAIPSTREEEWRFTDLSDLLQTKFTAIGTPSVSQADIAAFALPEAAQSRLVFVNGVYAPELSAVENLPAGVMVGNLAQASSLPVELSNYLAKQQGAAEVFTTLNTASLTDAAIVFVPRNQTLEAPIHLLFVATGTAISHPRCLVIAEASSNLTLIEDFVGLNQDRYFTNPVTEIWVAGNAEVKHTRVQRDSHAAFHIGKTAVSVDRDARYTCTAIGIGAELSRHNLEVYQTGEQTDITLNGLTILNGEQVGDTHSLIAYTKPYGTSHQVQKCIVNDRSHAIFNGKILVPQAAQLTDAAQLSRNLLLSPKARVDTKPQLEITADNVKCAHGATVSQLEDDEVFYLQSRGINQDSARKLLVYAFAVEVIQQIPIASLRDNLTAWVRTQQSREA